MIIHDQAKVFTSNYANRVVQLFTALLESIFYVYIFGHTLTVSSRCYSRCNVKKKLIPLCFSLNFTLT